MRRAIGVLTATLGDRYAAAVLAGIEEAAHAAGARIVVFAGGRLGAEAGFESCGNTVYDLVSAERLHGLIVLSGSLVNVVGPEKLHAFLQRFAPLPMVSVAVPLPSVPTVLVDAGHGMRGALAHLVEMHGRHKIAFIRGPSGNEEAEHRHRIYEETLADFAIPIDRDLIVQGAFTAESGAAAIETLLARDKKIDAVVAANDAMALTALTALHARGIRVPRDVSVIGFDDVEEATWSSPTLTTVRQPFERQGRMATEALFDMLDGKAPKSRMVLQTQAVVRESCGCGGTRGRASTLVRPRTKPIESHDALRGPLLVATQGVVEAKDVASSVLVVDALLEELFGKPGGFFATLEAMLTEIGDQVTALGRLQQMIGVLWRTALPMLDAERAARAADVLVRAHLDVAAIAEKREARKRLRSERVAHTLSNLGRTLIQSTTEREVAQALSESLPHLPIERCHVAVFDNEPGFARRILAYEDGRIDASPARFRSVELFPTVRTMFVQPLFFRDHQLGFVAIEGAPRHGLVFEELRDQLASALERVTREAIQVERHRELEEAHRMLIEQHRALSGTKDVEVEPLVAVRSAIDRLARLVEASRS